MSGSNGTAGAGAAADVVVLKFGGASFAAPGAHRRIAAHVAGRLGGNAPGPRHAVVVVSAVAGETDRLSAAMRAVSPDPDRELLAAALMTGETVNVALMTAALREAGLDAVPLDAADTGCAGIGEPHHAELRAIDPRPLRRHLAGAPTGTALVLPGGQGIGLDGRPVMLGRNSSDLSAIAAAIALRAPACEIFSDSPGICTADPRLVPGARTLATVGYDTMMTMSRHGAKVLHHSAVDWARRHGVEIHCRSLLPAGKVCSVVAAAPTSDPAVLVHGSGAVWAGEARLVHAVHAELTGSGSDAVVVHTSGTFGGNGKIWTADNRDGDVAHLVLADAVRDLQPRGLRHLGGMRLVTTLFPDGILEHRIGPSTDAAAAARALHETFCRPDVSPRHTASMADLQAGDSALR
ncbi:hypothetical protein [Frankia sp. AgB32]|uniref:amino acid kinase family protein n=1 Tax=Frankia sp. AgB32 TaxID=631119 RepID=UPI00200EF1A3|nr:hypothetical protein [Frankia sp. AgB32]MCK9894768.1 hypothetical protein [Frankia sp. AgB32]